MKIINSVFIVILAMTLQTSLAAKEIKLESGVKQSNLIELFTSEGCSSCPPAEDWLNNLKNDPRLWKQIIPVAFHVDYWDYIGWKDTFATPENTQRQQQYRQEGEINTVYTPGLLNNGKEWRRWFGLRTIETSDKNSGKLTVIIKDKQIKANFLPSTKLSKKLKLNVALLGFGFKTKIKAGENYGHELAHDFVVLAKNTKNSPNATWTMNLPENKYRDVKQLGVAVWVSQVNSQAPIQTVGGWLN